MNSPDRDDPELAALFASEHQHLPPDPFVGNTAQLIRKRQRMLATIRTAARAATFVLLAVASPWLVSGVAWISEALDSSIAWFGDGAGLALALIATPIVLIWRLRSR